MILEEYMRPPFHPPQEKFKLVRTLLFRQCRISNKIIWPFQKAWCKTYFDYYNEEAASQFWISNSEYILLIIKGIDPNDL